MSVDTEQVTVAMNPEEAAYNTYRVTDVPTSFPHGKWGKLSQTSAHNKASLNREKSDSTGEMNHR